MDGEDLLPISALQHLLFCPRQCALIHVERVWAENQFTAEGNLLHERAHHGPSESRPGLRIARGLPVICRALGLSGQCDVVEFLKEGGRFTSIVPIEYKRGKPKSHRADEVQLCAQALALEETFGVGIPAGQIFYGQPRRRTEVLFDEPLRELTRTTAAALHALLRSGATPAPIYEKRKCGACSLLEICQPKPLGATRSAAAWFNLHLHHE